MLLSTAKTVLHLLSTWAMELEAKLMKQLSVSGLPASQPRCCWGLRRMCHPRSTAGTDWTRWAALSWAPTRWSSPWRHSTSRLARTISRAENTNSTAGDYGLYGRQAQSGTLKIARWVQIQCGRTYLMATLVEHGKIDRHGVRHRVPLPAVPPDRARPEQVVLLGPPDRHGAFRAPALLVPQLNHRPLAVAGGGHIGLGFVEQAFRVVVRPHLEQAKML